MQNVIDFRAVRHEGRAYAVALVDDRESQPGDFECFTADDVRTFNAYWRFVTILVQGETGETTSLSSVVFGKLAGVPEVTMDTLVSDDYYVPALLREVAQSEARQATATAS